MSTAYAMGTAHAGPSTASIRRTASPTPPDRKSVHSELSTAVLSYPVGQDVEDYDAELGTLPSSDRDRPPWANALDRVKRNLLSRSRIRRAVDAVNWVLGPTERRPPPPPTALALTCAVTGGRRRLAAPLDPIAVRASKRGRLRHFYLLYLALWATGFILLIRAAYYQPGSPPATSCTAGPWENWPPDTCGLHMTECAAMLEEGTFRCPGGCQGVGLGNPRWVGGEEVNKRPFIVGGDGIYR